MNVKELRKELKQYRDDAEVYLYPVTRCGCWVSLDEVAVDEDDRVVVSG